jgi:hypothetical protein
MQDANVDLRGVVPCSSSFRRTQRPCSPCSARAKLLPVTDVYAGGDFDLVWPRDLFQTEMTSLVINQTKVSNWSDRVELLLEDAFASGVPRNMFSSRSRYDPRSTTPYFPQDDPGRTFLVELLRGVAGLAEAAARPLYWSDRTSGTLPHAPISIQAVTQEFSRIVRTLDQRGYFERPFEKDCVDHPRTVDPAAILENLTGRPHLWPMKPAALSQTRDAFFDLIEALHDLVARPQYRSWHGYSNCGWHHSDFAVQVGRSVYRWQINRLLARSDLGVRLATEGEDTGRLVQVTDDARTELVQRMVERNDESTGGQIRHAIVLFRSRSATEYDKRSAVVALAGVLEKRRALLKKELFSKDEQALFQIANQFAIRHENDRQQGDYDPVFQDWIFWFYLATVELTDRLIERQTKCG